MNHKQMKRMWGKIKTNLGNERVRHRRMGELVDDRLLGLAKPISILSIEIIRVLLYFKGLSNNARVIKWSRG